MSTINPDLSKYVATRTASGAMAKRSDNIVAQTLEGMTVDEVKTVATGMGVENVDKYDSLNPGQIRMNLGNRIRGAMAKTEREYERALAAVGADKADAAQKKLARTGAHPESTLVKVANPVRKQVDKRWADADKERAAKEAAAEKAAAEKAKAEKAKKAAAQKAKAQKAKANGASKPAAKKAAPKRTRSRAKKDDAQTAASA